jgi:hypothetical protein
LGTKANAAAAGGSDDEDDGDMEGFGYNVEGAVVFDGGCYSVGPAYIGPLADVATESDEASVAAAAVEEGFASGAGVEGFEEGGGAEEEGLLEDEEEEGEGAGVVVAAAPAATVMVEQALTVAGDRRMRLVATLKVAAAPGREVEVEVVRLLLFKEHWAGVTPTHSAAALTGGDKTTSSSSSNTDGAGRVVQIPGTVRLNGEELPPHTTNSSSSGGVGGGNSSSSSSSGVGGGGLRLSSSERWDVACIDLPRVQPDEVVGAWQVFTVAAQPVVEMDPDTLTER